VASNLIEALEEWVESQTSITDLFPGGTYQDDAPPESGIALPALTFAQQTGRVVNIIGRSPTLAIQYPELNVEVQAVYAEDARRIAETVAKLILSGGELSWLGGREVGRHQVDGEGGELLEGVGPDGSDVWAHRIPLVFVVVRD
jgi:hypothetical protein